MNIRSKIYGLKGPAESPLVCVKNPKGVRRDELLSIPVMRQQSRQADTRVEHRFPLAGETAVVTRGGTEHHVRLVNVCGGGAMITAAFHPALWESVELHLGEHGTVECSVIWIRHGRVGLEFAEATRLDLPEDDRAALVREVILRHFPEARFETPKHIDQSEEEQEHRSGPRFPFIWSGMLHCEYGSTPARVRNISPTGAMIETAFELAPGAEPYLELGEAGSIFGTIVWAQGDQSGLKFHERFDMARLAYAKPELSAAGEQLIHFGAFSR